MLRRTFCDQFAEFLLRVVIDMRILGAAVEGKRLDHGGEHVGILDRFEIDLARQCFLLSEQAAQRVIREEAEFPAFLVFEMHAFGKLQDLPSLDMRVIERMGVGAGDQTDAVLPADLIQAAVVERLFRDKMGLHFEEAAVFVAQAERKKFLSGTIRPLVQRAADAGGGDQDVI